MGNLCRLIIKDIIELNHVALVENPANKGCGIMTDSKRNRMTLKIEDVPQEN